MFNWLKRKKSREQEIEDELNYHLAMLARERLEAGETTGEAKFSARRKLGNRTLIKESLRDMWSKIWLEDFLKDIRVTIRQLRKSPGFTAAAVLSLALGISANTAIFTLINAVLLESLPVRDPGSLVLLGDGRASGNGVGIPKSGSFSLYSYDLYKHLHDTNLFRELCAFESTQKTRVSVRRPGWSESQPTQAKLVSGNYFELLGVNAAIGRAIAPSDDSPSARPVAVVSFRYWKEALDGDPSVIGSTIDLGGMSVTIVGVAPREFYGETLSPDPPSFWLPLSADRQLNRTLALIDDPAEHWLYLMGRLAPKLTTGQAQTRLTAALHSWLLQREGSSISAEQRKRILRSYIELTPGASGITHMQRSYSADFASAAWHFDCGSGHHVRQYREPSAGSRYGANGRDLGTARIGSGPHAPGASVSHRKPDARFFRRRVGIVSRIRRYKAADRALLSRRGLRANPHVA